MISAQVRTKQRTSPKRSLLNRTAIIIPTWNASRHWSGIEKMLREQRIAPDQVLIIDSSSADDTPSLAQRAGYRLETIPKESFRHGATRQYAAGLMEDAEILVYLTQDALLCGERSLQNMLEVFRNPEIGGCYGRQLPRAEAGPIERHARLFNYSPIPAVRSFEDRKVLGFRAAYFSNSFAAYRRTALDDVGGFPRHSIVSEEVTVAARMLIAGWKLAYQANATVVHSHDFTFAQEFSRYFDIGVHHSREGWILDEFGTVGGEGKSFVVSEARYLLRTRPSLLLSATARNASKWWAYKLGRNEGYLPRGVKEALSAQPGFWLEERRRQNMAPNRIPSPSTTTHFPA